MVGMQQPLVDVVQGIRHNLVVIKQPALVSGYEASIGHNFVVMEQQAFRITRWLWSKLWHNFAVMVQQARA